MLEFALILLIITSISAIQTRYMRHAVIYLGLFSLAISFVYLMFNAPDVAIAEAIIGSTISTILFIVVLQKHKIFTIYYKMNEDDTIDDNLLLSHKQLLIKSFEKFCSKQELEAQIIYSTEDVLDIAKNHQYAIILEESPYEVIVHLHPDNYKVNALRTFLEQDQHLKNKYKMIFIEDDEI
ncbi:MAG TPA: hypothetical protein DCS67_08550 [Clostridiales bacterium UBA8960]|nr:hypothetical protein [Clostridiales bacterium UBA8960]